MIWWIAGAGLLPLIVMALVVALGSAEGADSVPGPYGDDH